jgi:iron complex outermembrane receptor protein
MKPARLSEILWRSHSALRVTMFALAGVVSLSAQSTAVSSSSDNVRRSEVVELAPFEVAADAPGYQMLRTTTGTRLNTELRNVPQSLAILPRELLDDTMADSLAEALTYVVNVQPRQNVADGVRIRGIRTTRKYYNNYLVPNFVSGMANIARVEILKGPASAIYGRGELGGLVNSISLQPSEEKSQTVRVNVASNNHYEAKIDSTGPVPVGKGLTYRVTGSYLSKDNYQKFAETEQYGVFPSLKWEITPQTSLVYDGIFFHGLTPANEGTPFLTSFHDGAPPNMPEVFAPRELNTSGSSNGNRWDRRIEDVQMHFVSLTHEIGSFLYVRQGALIYDQSSDVWKMAISNLHRRNATTGAITLPRAASRNESTSKGTFLQGDVIARYGLFDNSFIASKHDTLAGYEYTDVRTTSFRTPGTIGDLDVYKPDYGLAVALRPFDLNSRGESNSYGYFFHHVSRFMNERLQASFSMRWDDAESSGRNLISNVSSKTTPRSTKAPRYGLSYRVNHWLSAYALRSEQEDPVTTVNVWGGLPGGHPRADERFTNQVTGTINEAGLKAELFDKKLSVTFSVFEMFRNGFIRGSNLTAAEYAELGLPLGQAGVGRNVAVTGEQTTGFELEWVGQLLPRLAVFGGFATMDAEGVSRGVRAALRGSPDYMFSSFFKYDLRPRGSLDGFDLKAGFSANGPMYSNQFTDIATKHAATERYDAGFGYRRGRYSIDVLVKNIFDEEQVVNAIAPGSNLLAPPRELWVGLTARF